jgi:superfamily II DNA or RNA helicase
MRDYQIAANAALERAWETKKRILMVMATGTGKTVVFAEQARRIGGALVLAHRDALIEQAARKLEKHTGEDVAIEKAERKAYPSSFVCASVQSLRGDRLERFAERNRFPLIIIDEAHRSSSPSYRDILAKFPEAKVLGVTATPDRGDGVGLWNVFEHCGEHGAAFEYDMRAGIDDCWLTDFDYRPVFAPIALDKIKPKKNGDLDGVELDAATVEFASEIARALFDSCHGRTLGFTPGVQTAHVVAECLNRLRPGCARAVDGEMDDLEKKRITRAHQRGDFDYLLNCAVYTEGYDDPGLLNVFDAALTKSRARHAQKVGRGTRPWAESPDSASVVDGAPDIMGRMRAIAESPKPRWNYFHLNGIGSRHDLATPVDLLAGSATAEERKLAKDILAERGGRVDDAIAEARARLDEERRRLAAAAAREAAARRAQIGDHRNPFNLLGLRPQAPWESEAFEPATPAQLGLLRVKGVVSPPKLSKMQASRLIGTVVKREKVGMADPGQLRKLAEMGITNGHKLYARKAREIIDAHQKGKQGWIRNSNRVERPEPGYDG